MAAPGTLWIGSTALTQGKEKWTITATKVSVTVKFGGQYSDCLSNPPGLGQALADYAGMFVSQINVTELDGDTGELEITLEGQVDPSTLTFEPLGPPVFELDFDVVVKPLEQHPLCGILKPDRAVSSVTQKQLTWEDWPLLTSDDYDATGNGTGIWASVGKWDLATYKARKEKGEDSYEVFAPVVKRTTIHLYPPSDVGSASGYIQFPPTSGFDVSAWQFLAGPDHCTRNERVFTRSSEWHGAEYIDTLIYSAAP